MPGSKLSRRLNGATHCWLLPDFSTVPPLSRRCGSRRSHGSSLAFARATILPSGCVARLRSYNVLATGRRRAWKQWSLPPNDPPGYAPACKFI
jgi:hypothetical protein